MRVSYSSTWSGGLVSRLHLAVSQNAGTARVWAVALVLACLLGSLAPGRFQAQTITQVPNITTVAGTGMSGYTGNEGPATPRNPLSNSARLQNTAKECCAAGQLCRKLTSFGRAP